jgi:hypothetical protein
MAVSFYANAARAIEQTGEVVAKESGWEGPTPIWDTGHNWTLLSSDMVSGGNAYSETRVELRPLDDLPTGNEDEAHGISIAVRAKAWIPEKSLAAWSRIFGTKSWNFEDLPEGASGEDFEKDVESWLLPVWKSAIQITQERREGLRITATQRKDVMDSPWDSPITSI